jgi:hypothetical protein
MIEFSGGPSAGDGNNGVVRVGETASSLAKLREGFAGVSGKKIFVILKLVLAVAVRCIPLSSRPSEGTVGWAKAR